jgi:hypothetical protein
VAIRVSHQMKFSITTIRLDALYVACPSQEYGL